MHASICVHALPSLHAVPSAAAGFEHAPLVGSHDPRAWHWSLAVHVTGLDPVHTPAEHAYVWLHLFVPEHVVPSGAVGFEHVPVLGSHVPTAWHASLAVHVTGLLPVHAPAWQVKVCSHLLVPLQAVPFAAGVWVQLPPPLHESTVHGLPSSQDDAAQHPLPALRMLSS
jgi:hypothetical protein